LGLEKLGLIKYTFLNNIPKQDENNETIYTKQYGIILTLFGYFFIDCLEHPTR